LPEPEGPVPARELERDAAERLHRGVSFAVVANEPAGGDDRLRDLLGDFDGGKGH
jgi:hypothetical protein